MDERKLEERVILLERKIDELLKRIDELSQNVKVSRVSVVSGFSDKGFPTPEERKHGAERYVIKG